VNKADREIVLDGSRGEGGGQILRSALTLSLLTGKPFRLEKIRANRSRPGLRPQHLAAVRAAAALGQAVIEGAEVGSRQLQFRPGAYDPSDLTHEIGTAGSTALVLQALHLAVTTRARAPVRIRVTGGTFNEHAPSFPFLDRTWRRYQELLGLRVALAMPRAGFYPQGGGVLEAWIEPGSPRSLELTRRGVLQSIGVAAGTLNLERNQVAQRMHDRAVSLLEAEGLPVTPDAPVAWSGVGHGAACALTAEFAATPEHGPTAATFVALGAPGKPAEVVAKEAADELTAFLRSPGVVDAHSADQLLLPMCLAEGESRFTTPDATEHLRTNAEVIGMFLDRRIEIATTDQTSDPVVVRIA
jgi:RNA 3'-terminal phosphate cyclase (ATP)